MRILVIPNDFPTSQNPMAGIFILRRLQAMQDLGHEISVLRVVPYTPPFAPAERWRDYRAMPRDTVVGGIPVRTVRAFMPPRMIGIEWLRHQVAGAVAQEIDRVGADLVHASYLIPAGQLAIRQQVPSIVTMHGVDAHTWPQRRPDLRRAIKNVLQHATQLTAVSGSLAQIVQDVHPCNVRVIWNGADERFFFPQPQPPARKKLGVANDAFVIAYAGAVVREKGVFELLRAASAMQPRPVVLIAGAGEDATALQQFANERGIDLRILGRLRQDAVAQVYAAADVVALASYIEGMPNVVCEAMLCGRAVVSTSVGGVPEIITDGLSGMLVPAKDPQALRAALTLVASDDCLRSALANAGRQFAATHLTWRKSAKKYEALYEEIAGARRAGAA